MRFASEGGRPGELANVLAEEAMLLRDQMKTTNMLSDVPSDRLPDDPEPWRRGVHGRYR